MAEKKATKPAKKAGTKATSEFTADEKAAMKERARELKKSGGAADDAAEVVGKIAAMAPADRALAEGVHRLVGKHAPSLAPKLWYGMPAYANADGKVVCFFQDAKKFKTRYATLGFSAEAKLDDGALWPTAFALTALGSAVEARIAALLKQATAG